jgi:hypothetical protein
MAENKVRASALVSLTGVLFVVLTLASFIVGGEPPDADDPIGEIVEFWVDNDAANMIGAVVAALAAVSLLFFAASLRRSLRRAEDGGGILSVAALAGGTVAAAGIGVDASLRFAAASLADEVDPVVIQTLNALWANFFFPMVIGLATLVLATSLSALRSRIIPVWLAWIGFLIVVVFFTPAGFVAFIASGVWITVVSILLWRRESASADPMGAPA